MHLQIEEIAEVFNSLSSYNRLYTYLELYDGKSPKDITFDLRLTRNALQHYITDWKDLDLIYSDGNDYVFTEKGEYIANEINDLT